MCAAPWWFRDALVRTRTRYISIIRALLHQHGFRVPSGSAAHIVQRGHSLPLPGRLRSVVAPLLAVMRPLNQQLTYSDATIEHLAVQDPRVPRLRSVPSIGPVTAAAFLAAIDDAQRFPHAHQLEADLGLVPGERIAATVSPRKASSEGRRRFPWRRAYRGPTGRNQAEGRGTAQPRIRPDHLVQGWA